MQKKILLKYASLTCRYTFAL